MGSGEHPMTTLMFAGILVAVGVGALAMLAADAMQKRAKVARRLQPLGQLLGATENAPIAIDALPQRQSEESPLVAALNKRFPLTGGVRTGIVAAIVGALGFAALLALVLFIGMPPLFAVPASLAGGTALGMAIGSGIENRKRDEYCDRLLTAMEDFQRMVRYGIPPMQALNSVTAATEEPLKESLRNVQLETNVGVPLEEAMAHEAYRVRISEMAMLAAILSTQASTGGNLSESVGNLAMMLRERRDNRAKMKATTAEPRLTLIVLGLMPLGGIGVQLIFQPHVISMLFTEQRQLLGIGLGLIAAGFVVSWMMVRSAQR